MRRLQSISPFFVSWVEKVTLRWDVENGFWLAGWLVDDELIDRRDTGGNYGKACNGDDGLGLLSRLTIYTHLSSSSALIQAIHFPFCNSSTRAPTTAVPAFIGRKVLSFPFFSQPTRKSPLTSLSPSSDSSIPILRLYIVRHRLRLLVTMVRVVRIIRWSDIFHLVGAAAFVAALEGAGAGDLSI